MCVCVWGVPAHTCVCAFGKQITNWAIFGFCPLYRFFLHTFSLLGWFEITAQCNDCNWRMNPNILLMILNSEGWLIKISSLFLSSSSPPGFHRYTSSPSIISTASRRLASPQLSVFWPISFLPVFYASFKYSCVILSSRLSAESLHEPLCLLHRPRDLQGVSSSTCCLSSTGNIEILGSILTSALTTRDSSLIQKQF